MSMNRHRTVPRLSDAFCFGILQTKTRCDIMRKVSILSLHLGYGGIEKSIVSLANLLSRKYNVEMPIVDCVFDVLYDGLDPREAVNILMTRKPREE